MKASLLRKADRVAKDRAPKPRIHYFWWDLDETWEQILDGLRAGCDEAEGKDWTVSADSTVARAHQHAAGARRVRAGDDPAGGFNE